MGLTWQYVLRLPSLHRSFQPHTPQSSLPTYLPYSITHWHYTTHSPSQLHLLFTQNSPQITGPHSTIIPASSINATAWSYSTPPTLTSTSKQIFHYNKHLHHSCWYLKGTVYKAMASCENCETISGVYKSAMAQVTCTMEYGICTLGLRPREDKLLPSGTNPIQLETHGTTITLLSIPFNRMHTPTHNPHAQTNPTIHNTQVHTTTMNRELWCVWLERSM